MCICTLLSSRICRTASYMGRVSTPAIFSASTIIVFSINCRYSVSLMVMYFVDSDFIFAIFRITKKSASPGFAAGRSRSINNLKSINYFSLKSAGISPHSRLSQCFTSIFPMREAKALRNISACLRAGYFFPDAVLRALNHAIAVMLSV